MLAPSLCTMPAAESAKSSHALTTHVGRELTDAERERHIRDCGRLAEMAMARYEETGCFDAIGEARRWAMLQAEAINCRSPAQIARMEAERGLA